MIKAIVTDIEGTTSSIAFVHDVLFPYAREHIGDYVRCHAEDAHVVAHLNDVRLEAGAELDLEGIIKQLNQWIDEDKKVTPLKALQGMVWEAGYEHGDFHGHVYADAFEYLKQWYENGLKLYIYSSGSVGAQKLLFAHTQYGDLTPLFSGYFDTRIGAKIDTASYRHIVHELNLPADSVLFLSDMQKELDAAKQAGMKTTWLVREGDLPDTTTHPLARDFSEIGVSE